MWLGNAEELIRRGEANLAEVIGCRDDIMVYLIHAGLDGGMAFKIMETVRKGQWNKIPDELRDTYLNAMKKTTSLTGILILVLKLNICSRKPMRQHTY